MAPINMIINYYITNAPTQAITAYTDAMKQFGITFLPDVAAFYSGSPNWPTGPAKEFGTKNQDTLISDYTAALSSDPNVVGYYVGDEPALTRQPQTFHQYGLIKGERSVGLQSRGVQPLRSICRLEGHRRYSRRRRVSIWRR